MDPTALAGIAGAAATVLAAAIGRRWGRAGLAQLQAERDNAAAQADQAQAQAAQAISAAAAGLVSPLTEQVARMQREMADQRSEISRLREENMILNIRVTELTAEVDTLRRTNAGEVR